MPALGRRILRDGSEEAGVQAATATATSSPSSLFIQTLSSGNIVEAAKLAPIAYAHWWLRLIQEDPWHVVVETVLLAFIIYLVLLKRGSGRRKGRSELSTKEVEELVAEWRPAPLVPPITPQDRQLIDETPVIEAYLEANRVRLVGDRKPKLNLVSLDFLGMGSRKELKDAAKETLEEYGCGSCGPRGFYGSVLPHVQIENDIAAFLGTEGAISYSDTASTLSSTTPAFAKRGDLLLVDAGISEAVAVGVELSRARVVTYRHNDMDDLKRALDAVLEEDKRLRRDATKQRRFIVSEALFRTTGQVVDLKRLVELKKKYGFRLILDESLSFGVMGSTGRGATEELGVPVQDVDILMVSMAYALASVGGVCVGNIEVVDHQRLSGAGYCFSASAPPFVSRAASSALAVIKSSPELLQQLRDNTTALRKAVQVASPHLVVVSAPQSPVIHVGLAETLSSQKTVDEQATMLRDIVHGALVDGIFITEAKHLKNEKSRLDGNPVKSAPTLRITARATLTPNDVKDVAAVLRRVCERVLRRS
mmetsp:Transcript_10670/g.30598  ORF Transcript_10670/g.30598 Transcript_10670/m.30598 type:complete len:536 (-) Transcript_10670:10-1617(-)